MEEESVTKHAPVLPRGQAREGLQGGADTSLPRDNWR